MSESLADLAWATVDSLCNLRRIPHAAFTSGATLDLQGNIVDLAYFETNTVPQLLAVLPDLRARIRGALSGVEQAALRLTCTGTHTGPLFDVPATGRTLSFSTIVWMHFDALKVRHIRVDWNAYNVQQPLTAARRKIEAHMLALRGQNT